MTKARILITIKPDVLDPAGVAINKVLSREGFAVIKHVRIGKVIDIDLDGDAKTHLPMLEQVAATILSNPIMEDFTISIDEHQHERAH